MASLVNAALAAAVATAFWTLLGLAISRQLLPSVASIGAAPVLGWAAHSAVTLPLLELVGLSSPAVLSIGAICAILAGASLRTAAAAEDAEALARLPISTCVAAAFLALAPAAAIVPKFVAGGVQLADPIFDHSKIAIVDAMTRQGLPPSNPIFGEDGTAGHLAYYYLWHFSAAQLALPLHISGWEADIALTWFTAFASLMLMMGLAVWLGRRSAAAVLVVLLAAAASLRAVLGFIFGSYQLNPMLSPSNGFAGWLFQAAWVPQHLMSASCVVLAMVLVAQYARWPGLPLLLALIVTVAAAFESSTYVGGVTFAVAGVAAAPALLWRTERDHRPQFAAALTLAAVLALCLSAPFIRDQMAAVVARGDSRPVTIRPFEVLGTIFPPPLRQVLDLPAYWLVELPLEFPASYVAGAIGLFVLLRSAKPPERPVLTVLACLAGAGLATSWLLASTVGDNNDLGLRAVLPAVVVLIVTASAAAAGALRHGLVAGCALGGLALSLPDTLHMLRYNISGRTTPDAALFAQAPDVWSAVRRYASPTMRVANDPLFLQNLTAWPVNISWALLADRSSCFAGRELTLAFAPLPSDRREAINAQFIRVFAGRGSADDVADMANKYGCEVAVVLPQDGAWTSDPFASSPEYRLAENRQAQWRIYVSARASR
jgi:hypothetical protein